MATTSGCSCCVMQNREIYNLSNSNNTDKVTLIGKYIESTSDIKSICRKCWRKFVKFESFKNMVMGNITKKHYLSPEAVGPNKRQMTKTPKRNTVVEQIIHSVEKLKFTSESAVQQSDNEDCVVGDHLDSDVQTSGNEDCAVGDHLYTATPFDRRAHFGITKPKKVLFPTDHHSYAENTNRPVIQIQSRQINNCAKEEFISEVEKSVAVLSRNNTSILSTKNITVLSEEDLYSQAEQELALNVPLLFDLLNTLIGGTGNKKATVAMIYAMILNSRNRKISAIQKMMTVLAVKCHADNKILMRLNKLHITMSVASKKNIISDMSEACDSQIIQTIASGVDGKLNGDNVDVFVHTNDIRMSNRNLDYHFFATDWTPFRITPEDFETNPWLREQVQKPNVDNSINIGLFAPNVKQFKDNIKILVARKLIDYMPHFSWMKMVVPDHVEHELQELTSRPTTSHCMPILLLNEMKYDDCIRIMDAYEQGLAALYNKAGRGEDFDNLQIPVGGDQLTRVRLDGAKCLRLGAHHQRERFDNLYPIVIEMFHTQMDFLEKTVKKFMKEGSGRDSGTLRHLQILIQRTSVNCNVKSRFNAHEEFVEFCGDAYLLEAAIEHFGMETLESSPTKNTPPENINRTHHVRRHEVFDELMDGFLDIVQGPLGINETTVNLMVDDQPMSVPLVNDKLSLQIEHEGRTAKVHIPYDSLKKSTIKIPVFSSVLEVKLIHENDDLKNYIKNFLQYYFILLNFKDAIAEGDIFRTSNMLKFMIPIYYKHSKLSKYMIECIDFILKTELLLPPRLALQVRVASFVNPKGRVGKNKAADMQKENQVKELKDMIKGLGANKTEGMIVKLSKANVVIDQIVDNLDRELGCKDVTTTHKPRGQMEDLNRVLGRLRTLRPFNTNPERKLKAYPRMQSSVFLELRQSERELNDSVLQIAERCSMGVNIDNVDDTEIGSDIDHEEVIECI